MKIVITGGHHTSALPVIKKLKEKHPDLEIHWFGHKHSAKGDKNPTLEYREITELDIKFYNLHAGKLYKTYDPIRIIKVPFGVLQAFYLLLRIRPKMILSFGGYLAAPVVLAGRFLKIPSITHEQTVVTGHANKFISKYVQKILITWPQSEKYFPKNKVIMTGLPLREEIFETRSDALQSNNNLPTVYITAGKLGSNKINVAVEGCLPRLLNMCNVVHQAGDVSVYNDFDRLSNLYERLNPKPKGNYFLRKFVFEGEIGEAYSTADLVVSRSGAHTILELIALKKPAILIPIPWVSHNEQSENAKILNDSGLAVILEERELTPESLLKKVEQTLDRIPNMTLEDTSLEEMVNKNATDLIVSETENFF